MADDLFAPPDGPAQPDRPRASASSGSPSGAPSSAPLPVPPPPPDQGAGFAAGAYYAPGWVPEPPRTEPLALASIPAGVVLGPVGIGLGAAALSRVRTNRSRGRGLAVAGMVVGAVVTLAWGVGAAVWWQADQASTPLAGDVSEPATVDARRLVVGSCLDELPPDGEVSSVRVVPCADEHRAQVVARTDFGAGEVWPGQDAADARVARVCGPEVLGEDPPDDVELVVWSPTEASWGAGDRTGLCLVGSAAPLGDLLS
ncbi:DUF4190 domain-containing protein [Cellulosimicrobium terreum]|nr:DUF4190 domain-containing protein [Cellulosimicrobium terreum]